MEMVKNAVNEMIEGVQAQEVGINWAKPTANFSGERTYTWSLTESVVNFNEDGAVADRIGELVYADMLLKVEQESQKVEDAELRVFSINSGQMTRSLLNEDTGKYDYSLRISYYMAF